MSQMSQMSQPYGQPSYPPFSNNSQSNLVNQSYGSFGFGNSVELSNQSNYFCRKGENNLVRQNNFINKIE